MWLDLSTDFQYFRLSRDLDSQQSNAVDVVSMLRDIFLVFLGVAPSTPPCLPPLL